MTDDHKPVTEADLHAFVDGFLDEERRREVELWLKDHPEEDSRGPAMAGTGQQN